MLKIATSATYWILVIIWSYVLYFYISRLKTFRQSSKLVHILFIVLTVDAFRTLFESVYFGAWYTSLSGLLPAYIGQVLTRPEYVFIPKIVNVVAGLTVVRIILNYWVPEERKERERIAADMNILETTVRARTDELQELFDGAPLGLLLMNGTGQVINANREACIRLGYDQDECVGMALGDLIDSPEAVRNIEASMFTLRQGESARLELQWMHKQKKAIQVESIIQRMRHNDKFMLMFLDITERKRVESRLSESEAALKQDIAQRMRTEEALEQSEFRFRKALLEAPFPIMIHADGDEVVLISRAWTEITGYTHEDIPTITAWTEKAYGIRMEQVRTQIGELYASEQRKDEGEFEIRCKNGSSRIWYFYSVPLDTFADGRRIVMSMAFDLTEHKDLEMALLNAKVEADSSNKAKSEFLANMSHEIRTPINGILGMLQLMETTSLNREQAEFISMAMRSTNRLTRLLSDILDLSRIEAGKLVLEEDVFDMLEQKKSVLELFSAPAKEKGLDLDFVVHPAVPKTILGDKSRLRQILFNLVGNAIKFTEQGFVRVDVSVLPVASETVCRILFTVADTGIGIRDEQVNSIFEPFSQAERAHTRRFQGAGLGLSIVRRLVNLMDGEIAIDNESEGTTIYLTLPFRFAEPVTENIATSLLIRSESISSDARLRILLVEDDAVSLMFGTRLLEKSGHAVTTAMNGREALECVEKEHFDLIFMDIQMPIMDGVEATRAIRESRSLGVRSRTPIIAMTAYAMVGEEEQFMRAGMDGYIAKPADGNTIRSTIHRVLKERDHIPHLMKN